MLYVESSRTELGLTSGLTSTAVPIMREHHLSVMSLEEYEPNPEFVGRNFNAGEVIQLVLKARSGHWLPFNYVQMVMMHEFVLPIPYRPITPSGTDMPRPDWRIVNK